MDGTVFDARTRRRFGLATGGVIATLLIFDRAQDGAAKRKKRRKRRKKCGKHEKLCQGQCIPRSQCCTSEDCFDSYCCEGECVSSETCCGGHPCDEICPCRRNVEATQVCISTVPVLCAQCHSNDECPEKWHCIPTRCGDVTATCRPLCAM